MAVTVIGALALSSPALASETRTGALSVRISGLSVGQSASVLVTGPQGYTRRLGASRVKAPQRADNE